MSLSMVVLAQPEDAKVETINGERVYVHVVQSGNTLWGIHNVYNVPVETIIKRNPSVEKGLQEGQVIYIPVPVVNETKTHVVQAGETLYGISRKYNVSVEDLTTWNPEVSQGLKIDQVLKIQISGYVSDVQSDPISNPQSNPKETIKVSYSDSVVEHKVGDSETLYSISKRYMVPAETIISFNNKPNNKIKKGEILKIPLKKESIEKVPIRVVPDKQPIQKIDSTLLFPKKDEYHVAIMLPFFLDRGTGYSETVSDMATEFLMGAQMALDSLESLGFRAKVHVYDSKNDSASVMAILNKPEFKQMDLVIGPLYKNNAGVIANWCKKNKVRLVCPVNVDAKILENNPFVYTSVTSDFTLMRGLTEYAYENFKTGKIILIKPTKASDSLLYNTFRNEFNKLGSKTNTKIIETTQTGFTAYLTKSTKTIIIFPSSDKANVAKFYNELTRFSHKTSKENTVIVGLDEWLDYENISGYNKNEFNLTTANGLDFNYNYPKTKYYNKKYRSRYRSDFTKMSAQGFDVTFNFCMELLMDRRVGRLIMNDFKSVQVPGGNHGYENVNTEIISVQDFELINVKNVKK